MAMATADNGVNVQALLDAREALKDAPAATQFTWRASCKWVNGTYSEAKVSNFFGLGEEQAHKTETTFEADHPEIFASEDRGIQLRSVESRLEGEMDIQGILGMDSDVRNGYEDIKVVFDIDADASQEEIEAIVAQSQKRSAVYDALTNPVNVSVEVVKT